MALVHALTACHKLSVQQYSCQGLANLAHGEAVAEEALLEAEAAPALTAAIEAHVSRPEITHPAVRALRNICVSPALQGRAVAAGGIEAALKAMEARPSDLPLQARPSVRPSVKLPHS